MLVLYMHQSRNAAQWATQQPLSKTCQLSTCVTNLFFG